MRVAPACLLALVCAAAGACCSAAPPPTATKADSGVELSLFFTTELRGNIEPCGCTSNPMGDLARLAAVVAKARAERPRVMVVDGGSTLYQGFTIPDYLAEQERLKSDLLANALSENLRAVAIGLGPYDLAGGAARVRPPRLAANLPEGSGIAAQASELVDVGGVAVGVFGVVSPHALEQFGISATDPVESARRAVADLQAKDARLIVGIAHMSRKEALKLAKKVDGIDFLLPGEDAPEPGEIRYEPDHVGNTWIVQPANRGQILTRVDVTLRGKGPLADAVGKARAAAEILGLEERAEGLRADLAKWEADPDADRAFLATKTQELTEIEAQRAELAESPLRIPPKGGWFTLTQIEIVRGLPCDAQIQAAKVAYDKASGEANVKAAAGRGPTPPPAGEPGYVGREDCEECHETQAAFWAETGHSQAWETLEAVGKQFNFDCIYCHVTGWQKPGGSTLAVNENLRDVQCEVCHGPGSIHVDKLGEEKPFRIRRLAPESVCKECHNQEHSDTFEYEAYLRTITGKGHGEEFRAKLGDGPNGRDLRAAAEKKAGIELGEGCLK